MTEEKKSEWFYCIVENDGTKLDQLSGFRDDETKTEFIPVFKTKEEAQQCFLLMPKDVIKMKYEIQAVIKDDLILRTEETGHKIFVMDSKGKIIKELEK